MSSFTLYLYFTNMLQDNAPSERLATERLLRTTKESAWEKGLRLAKEVGAWRKTKSAESKLHLTSFKIFQRKKMAQEKKGSDAEFEQKKMTLGITVDTREQEQNKENVRRDARDLRNKLLKKERTLSQDDQSRRGWENESRSRPADESAHRSTKVRWKRNKFRKESYSL